MWLLAGLTQFAFGCWPIFDVVPVLAAGALPPLGLLPALAAGATEPTMKPAIAMARRLKSELPRMLEEHQGIVAALQTLIEAARRGQRPDIAAFAEKLKLHAQTEEDVLYPAAILVGEFLQAKLT